MTYYNLSTEVVAVAAQNDHPFDATSENPAESTEMALKNAEDICAERKLRLTPVRRKVLEILLQGNRAMGAYAILDVLRRDGFGSQPPVVYRALDFLVSCGFVHKIERMNAFVACDHPEDHHSPAFLICRVCETVEETQTAPAKTALGGAARASGFQIERTVVEAEGVCPSCSDAAPA